MTAGSTTTAATTSPASRTPSSSTAYRLSTPTPASASPGGTRRRLRGAGTKWLTTFPANTYDGSSAGLALGTDVNVIGGAFHSKNAVFPLAATTSSTPGGPIPSGEFVNEGGTSTGTPLCLDDTADSSTAGSAVKVNPCANDAEQNFYIESNGTIELNGLCLAPSSGTASGTPVVLSTCSGTSAQQWTQGTGNTLVNTGAGLCLTDPSKGTAGSQLEIVTCAATSNQVWPLPAAQGPPAPPAVGQIWPTEQIEANSEVPCLNDAHSSVATGNPVEFATCAGYTSQSWTVDQTGTHLDHQVRQELLPRQLEQRPHRPRPGGDQPVQLQHDPAMDGGDEQRARQHRSDGAQRHALLPRRPRHEVQRCDHRYPDAALLLQPRFQPGLDIAGGVNES